MAAYLVDIIAKDYFGEVTTPNKYGQWVCARPLCLDGLTTRLCHAWKVLIGEYDVLVWGTTNRKPHR